MTNPAKIPIATTLSPSLSTISPTRVGAEQEKVDDVGRRCQERAAEVGESHLARPVSGRVNDQWLWMIFQVPPIRP